MIVNNNDERILMADVKLPFNAVIATREEEARINELREINSFLEILEKKKKEIQEEFKLKLRGGEDLYTSNGFKIAAMGITAGRKQVNIPLLESLFPEAAKVCIYAGEDFKRFMLK